MNKNYVLEFWRFTFTILICLLHFNGAYYNGNLRLFNGGYIAVEFFFLLSGFLLCASYDNKTKTVHDVKSPLQYTLHRIKHLYPHYIFSFIIVFIYHFLNKDDTIKTVTSKMISSIWEILLLHMTGIDVPTTSLINGQGWYLSVLLIVGYFVYYLLVNHRKTYMELIAPFSVLMIYAYFSNQFGHVDVWWQYTWIKSGLLRGLAGMNLGCISYLIYDKYKDYNFSTMIKYFLDFFQFMCFIFVIALAVLIDHSQKDFLQILVLFVAITLTFINKGNLDKKMNNKLVDKLGKISYSVFLNHVFVIWIFVDYFPNKNNTIIPVYILLTIIYSMITDSFIDFIVRKIKILLTA